MWMNKFIGILIAINQKPPKDITEWILFILLHIYIAGIFIVFVQRDFLLHFGNFGWEGKTEDVYQEQLELIVEWFLRCYNYRIIIQVILCSNDCSDSKKNNSGDSSNQSNLVPSKIDLHWSIHRQLKYKYLPL